MSKILHLKFYDHMSLTNEWHDLDLILKTKILECEVIGFLIREDNLAYYLATMLGGEEMGSCHVILKSTITSIKEYPKKAK